MCRPPAIGLASLLLACLCSPEFLHARTELQLIGDHIPSRLFVGSPHIFSGSDTLYLNGRILAPEIDYRFLRGEGYFDLSSLATEGRDTLRVVFSPLPGWVLKSYGRALPEVGPPPGTDAVSTALEPATASRTLGSDIKLSGSKSFRFSARSAGASEFSQSLDLTVAGELSAGVEIIGSISDRGYNPAYGTANSRLNELDKVMLKVTSPRVTAQVGDIVILDSPSRQRGKTVSGASFDLQYPHWHIDGAAARPRGTFETFEFTGRDGYQGPYQVGVGSSALPIVPGSETVWLDGERLQRGANKDYTVDYPTGRITFNVNHPIDRRSRAEVDYEPQATDYREQLVSIGGGAQLDDSTFFVSMSALGEGDDKGQPLAGDLSDSDRVLLNAAGDSVAVRSGAIPDTNGAYLLVLDSLPDTVFQFAGDKNGDYRVSFSFVGPGSGDYRFLGSGNYEYVGSGYGDYLPVVVLPAPEKASDYRAKVGVQNATVGEILLDLRASNHDRNLWSGRDDSDNEGLYYRLQSARRWQWHGRSNSLMLQRRVRQATYRTRERLNRADFRREFFLPDGPAPSADETLHELTAAISPAGFLTLTGSYGDLDYEDTFDSRKGGLGAELSPAPSLRLKAGWSGVSSNLANSSLSGDGSVNTYTAEVFCQPFSKTEFVSSCERDVRRNEYGGERRGTRYDQVRLRLSRGGETAQYEYFVEDSLTSAWGDVLTRSRLRGSSSRRLGELTYDMILSYQWLDRPSVSESNFLGRLNLRYDSSPRGVSLASSYLISEEQRNARGISYLEVEPGQGNFSVEEGRYVPDPDGNYIQVEEILSDTARVRRAEKSFRLTKDSRIVLVRFTSNIQEELLEGGKRNIWWVLPFVSDESQPYLFFSRRYDADIRLWPVRGFHAINLSFSQDLEKRSIVGLTRRRRDTKGELSLKQGTGGTYLEESLEVFRADRDSYFSGAGEIEGYKINLMVRGIMGSGELTGGGSFRRAESALEESSRQYAVHLESRLRVLGRSELRLRTELYRQDLTEVSGAPSYRLTGNRYGKRGAVWSLSLNYGTRSGMRLNFTMNGRHSDDRTARITARGEVVAGF